MAEFEAPGVFVEEVPFTPRMIDGVPTTTAGIVGYTRTAVDPASGKKLTLDPTPVTSLRDYERLFGGAGGAGYDLHAALGLFFANGGARAVIVSIGPFGPAGAAGLRAGLAALAGAAEPAMLLAPDALRLPKEDYHAFLRDMIESAAASRRRMAIVDLHGGGDAAAASAAGLESALADFRAAMAPLPAETRSFAAAYHPWLLTADGPVPPSAAIAGLWARNDIDRGVWKAPANLSPVGVTGPAFAIPKAAEERMGAPPDGIAVNPIRKFPGRGTLVWGARTLAGNDAERRYVNVRRMLIHVEQSIAAGLQGLCLEPNDARTWSEARAMTADFMRGLWRAGGLQGAKPEEAYFIRCGLGETMTQNDLDNGRLVLVVGMAPVRPAEFVIVSIAVAMHAA